MAPSDDVVLKLPHTTGLSPETEHPEPTHVMFDWFEVVSPVEYPTNTFMLPAKLGASALPIKTFLDPEICRPASHPTTTLSSPRKDPSAA